MTAHEHSHIHKMICESFGEELSSPVCQEIADHLKGCRNCRIMYDSVRKTVALYREDGREQPLPKDVAERLAQLLALPDKMEGIAKMQEILAKLRDLKPQLSKRFKTMEIQLFGSNVRGDQTERSDIDVLVEFEEGADLFDLIGVATFLEEQLQRKVDVIPKQALREELREAILREAILV